MRSQPKAASIRAVGSILAVAVMVLALFVAPAQATTGHTRSGSFGISTSNEPGGFWFGSPSAVAINSSNGHVFTADPGHEDGNGQPAPRIEEFDAAGAYVAEFPLDPATYSSPQSLAIDPSGGGAIYVGANNTVTSKATILKYSLTGTLLYALAPATNTDFKPSALAVDPSNGDVYVGAIDSTSGAPLVEVFDDAGAFQYSFDGAANNDSALAGVSRIAVDGSSHVYVLDSGKKRVDRFSAAGAFQMTVVDGEAGGFGIFALAADSSTDELFVVENNGDQIESFTAGGAAHQDLMYVGGSIADIAVNPNSGTIFIADPAFREGFIWTAFAGPTVETTNSSPVDGTTQTLEGTIDPEGIDAEYHFEYGPDRNYGSSTASVSAGSGNTAEPVSDQAAGLLPNTTYHFRLVGTNANGAINGADRTFTTAPAPPILDGAPPFVTEIKPDGATLHGTLNPRGSATSWHFEYQEEGAPSWTSTTLKSVDASQGDQSVSEAVTGLTPGTRYHYRLVADNGTGGPQPGQEATFWTAPAAAGGATSITGISATLQGTVNPHEGVIKYHFEYGETTSYGHSTPDRPEGEFGVLFGEGDQNVEEPIDRLKPGTTYHVRVVATVPSIFGGGPTVYGVDGTFTTDPAPTAVTGAATGVTTEQATFSGEVDTHGLGGSYRFIVQSPTSPFSAKTEVVTVPPGAGAGSVSATLGGLQPGQTYTVRLAVESSSVITNGNAVTFSTPPLPAASLPPPRTDSPYGPPQTLPPQTSPGAFAARAKANGSTATLTLQLPGPGEVTVRGTGVKTAKWRAGEAGTYTVKVGLSPSGRKSLRKHSSLTSRLHITFKPSGGKAATKTAKVTFKEAR